MPPSSSNAPDAWLAELGWAGRFRVLEKIGGGGMGQVWRAVEIATEKEVALKFLAPHDTGDENLLARLEIEASALMKLQEAGGNPFVVEVIDFAMNEQQACLVTAFVPGMDLVRWSEAKALSLRERVELIASAATGAAWCHQHGVIHRDLKPSNILVNAQTHQPVIVDFSIAKMEENITLTLTNEAIGTAPYMAPEQFDRTRGDFSPATDVYALGATLYELITAVVPHPGSYAQIVQRHSDEVRPAAPSALNPAIPRVLDCILLKAIAHRPVDRYQDGAEMAQDLQCFLDGKPVTARPVSKLVHAVRQARRRPALAGALAGCGILAALWVGVTGRAIREKNQRELTDHIVHRLVSSSWTPDELQDTEQCLQSLSRIAPDQARTLRDSFRRDVADDIANELRRSSAISDGEIWVTDCLQALTRMMPEEASSASRLLEQRKSRWTTVLALDPLYVDASKTFPTVQFSANTAKGLVLSNQSKEKAQQFRFEVDLPFPFEVTVRFASDQSNTMPSGLIYSCAAGRIEAMIAPPPSIPSEVLNSNPLLDTSTPYTLYVLKNGLPVASRALPKTGKAGLSSTVTLRTEVNQITVTVDSLPAITTSILFGGSAQQAGQRLANLKVQLAPNVAISSLALRTRSQAVPLPIEDGDLDAAAGRWEAAARKYNALLGDPILGAEAAFKLGVAMSRLGKFGEAEQAWEMASASQQEMWKVLAQFELWSNAVLHKGTDEGKKWLDRLPATDSAQSIIRNYSLPKTRHDMVDIYRVFGSVSALSTVTGKAVADSLKAYRLLDVSPLQTASDLALGVHLIGMEELSRTLLKDALKDPPRSLTDQMELWGINALETWSRVSQMEKDPDLERALTQWAKAYADRPAIVACLHLENIRRLARKGRAERGLELMVNQLVPLQMDPRTRITVQLVHGTLLQNMGRDQEAQSVWRESLKLASSVRPMNVLAMMDLVASADFLAAWDKELCMTVLASLLGRSADGSARNTVQSVLLDHVANNSEFVDELNRLKNDPMAFEVIVDQALCRRPPRQIAVAGVKLMLGRYVIGTGLPDSADAGTKQRAQQVIDQVIDHLQYQQTSLSIWPPYFAAWMAPALAPTWNPSSTDLPTELTAKLHWLLWQRCLRLKNQVAADAVAQSLRNTGALGKEWMAQSFAMPRSGP